jgi:tRNA A-37 threonylcarbamoyl transferase component Bud32
MIELPQDAAREALEVVGSIPGELVALAAYGSQVAGYASSGSDYDLMAVFREGGLRYYYVRSRPGGRYFSVLRVGLRLLEGDAERAELGEFVVGRLLNPYQALVGGDVVERAARAYRRRVVLEELARLAHAYGQFATEILAPPEYFLFSRLRRRARIYPPARYSYVRTYSGPEGPRNLEFSASRFREALDGLASEGIVERVGGMYRALRPPLPRRPPELDTLALAVRQYAAHASSGRVSPRVFAEELTSKARRSRAAGALRLEPLERPELLLSLPEGRLSFEGLSPLIGEARGRGCSVSRRPLGEFYSTVRLLEVRCGGGPASPVAVVKEYSSPWAAKWTMVMVAAAGVRPMRLSPVERLASEYAFLRLLRRVGFRTPGILLVDPRRILMAREYVEGRLLEAAVGEEDPFRELGRLMRRLHSAGVTLGDVKPSNFLVPRGGGGIYLIDCEQAARGGSAPWDVASFLYLLAPLGRRRGAAAVERSAIAFLEGYAGGDGGGIGALEEALEAAPRYLAPLSPLLMPGEGAAVAAILSRFLSSRRARGQPRPGRTRAPRAI